MPRVPVYNMEGEAVGEIELKDEIFAAGINEGLLHQAVVTYLANQRQGTVATKNRALVRGGGRKPWRQKGTGRARQGSIRAPQWVGGGTVFGPTPRDYRMAMPKKARRAALRSALSAKVAAGELVVVDELTLAEPKTRVIANVLERLDAAAKALIVTGSASRNVYLASRNIPGVKSSVASDLNVYDVLNHGKLVMTKEAVSIVEEVLA